MFKAHNKPEICPITTVLTIKPVITSCGHVYEKSALELWLSGNKTCPLCREQLYDDVYTDIGAALIKRTYIQSVVNNMNGGICSFMRHLW